MHGWYAPTPSMTSVAGRSRLSQALQSCSRVVLQSQPGLALDTELFRKAISVVLAGFMRGMASKVSPRLVDRPGRPGLLAAAPWAVAEAVRPRPPARPCRSQLPLAWVGTGSGRVGLGGGASVGRALVVTPAGRAELTIRSLFQSHFTRAFVRKRQCLADSCESDPQLQLVCSWTPRGSLGAMKVREVRPLRDFVLRVCVRSVLCFQGPDMAGPASLNISFVPQV